MRELQNCSASKDHEIDRNLTTALCISQTSLDCAASVKVGSLPPLALFAHRKAGSQPRAPAFFKLPNLVCGRSEGLLPALHVEMYMAQHLSLSAVASTGRRNTLIFSQRWSVGHEVSSQDLLFN
jgi:hypothetical protein